MSKKKKEAGVGDQPDIVKMLSEAVMSAANKDTRRGNMVISPEMVRLESLKMAAATGESQTSAVLEVAHRYACYILYGESGCCKEDKANDNEGSAEPG